MLHHIQNVMKRLYSNTKGMKPPHLPGSCSFSTTCDFAVLPFKGLFINRQLKSSLGGGRQGSMNQFCKQGNQGKERLSNTKWVTEQGSGRTRLSASLGAPSYHGLFYLPADWAQVFHPVLPTPPTGRM